MRDPKWQSFMPANGPCSRSRNVVGWSARRKLPTYFRGHVLSWVCDNYLIETDISGEQLHRFPDVVTELG